MGHVCSTTQHHGIQSDDEGTSSKRQDLSGSPNPYGLRKSMATAGWFLTLAGALTAAAAAALSCGLAMAAARPTFLGSSSSTSLDCATVTSVLADCGAFVTYGSVAWPQPATGTPCCDGVTQLYAQVADSADNWRSVCGCMAGLVRRYSSNASAIAPLPVVSGVLPGRHTLDNFTYYTSPPCRP